MNAPQTEQQLDFYDAPGEMERESVKRILECYQQGGKWSHAEVIQWLKAKYGRGYEANTIDKAHGSLRKHGYKISKPERVNEANGKYHFVYWLITEKPGEPIYDYSAGQTAGNKSPWEFMTLIQKIEECKRILGTFPDDHPYRENIRQNIADLERLAGLS